MQHTFAQLHSRGPAWGAATGVVALALAVALGCSAPAAWAAPPLLQPSASALLVAQRVRAAADAAGQPFAVVDKRAALLVVFHGDGRLAGTSPVLLGRDAGDGTAPGVGERTQAGTLRPGDATTPAGRFDTRSGQSLAGDSVIWLDYAAAFAIHRVRPGASLANRLHRLATPSPADNHVSWWCRWPFSTAWCSRSWAHAAALSTCCLTAASCSPCGSPWAWADSDAQPAPPGGHRQRALTTSVCMPFARVADFHHFRRLA